MKRKDFLLKTSAAGAWLSTVFAGIFVLAIGAGMAAIMVALPLFDIIPQAVSLASDGWPKAGAWVFSIVTSVLPIVYSFTKDADNGWLFHVFFWSLRIGDALMDAMSIGVYTGATAVPTFKYLLHATESQLLAFAMVFIISNATDYFKDFIVYASQKFPAWAVEQVSRASRHQANTPTRKRNGYRPLEPEAKAQAFRF